MILSARIYCAIGVLALLAPVQVSGQQKSAATPKKLRLLRGTDGGVVPARQADTETVGTVGEEWKSMLDLEREDEVFWDRELQGSLPTVCNGLTLEQRQNQITAIIVKSGVSDERDLLDPKTPQGQALDWLINDDERFLCPKDKNLSQRYIMAVFYYSTEGEKWNECSAVDNKDDKDKDNKDQDKDVKDKDAQDKDAQDKDAQDKDAKDAKDIGGDNFNDRSRGGDDDDERLCNTREERKCYKPCKERNNCKNGDKKCLQKCRKKCCGWKKNKRGSSDSTDGGRSDRDGSRFLQVDKDKDKDNCGAPNSAFPGKNPYLSESSECDWAGSKCDNGNSITEIGFEQNNLAGTFPAEFFALNKLQNLTLEGGQTSGRIPSEWGDMESIQILDLDQNRLSGPIPENLYNLDRLKVLDIDENQLTGSISTNVGKLKQLIFVEFEENNFKGTIPDEFGNLKNLRTATFRDNGFTGTMPQSVCDNRKDKLVTLTADCAGDNPQIECECCTACFQ